MTSDNYFIGVDVGTGSVRAALVNKSGEILKVSINPIITWNPKPNFYEQSSQDIWRACCIVVKNVVKDVDTKLIKGIGFDATCSLVVLDKEAKPLTVSITGKCASRNACSVRNIPPENTEREGTEKERESLKLAESQIKCADYFLLERQ